MNKDRDMPGMSQQGNAEIVENSQVLQCWTFKNPEQFTQKNSKATQFAIYEFKYKRRDSSSLRGKTFLAGKHFLQAFCLYLAHETSFRYKYIC